MGTWEESSSNAGYSGETAAVAAMAVGSLLIIIGVAAMVIRNRRHRRLCLATVAGVQPVCSAEMCVETPTDFMNNLASWDHCHPIDEMLEKRRRAVWTLEMFESCNIKDLTHKEENPSEVPRVQHREMLKNPLICL